MDAKKTAFIKHLHDAFGNITQASESVGIKRQTYYNWMKSDDEFREAIESIDEYIIDSVEKELYTQIKDGSTAATIFFLKTRAKHRGYVEKQEVDHTTKGESINVISLGSGVDPEQK